MNKSNEVCMQGVPASRGIVAGPAFIFEPPDLSIPDRPAESPAAELARFQAGKNLARNEIQEVKELLLTHGGAPEQAAIFDAHLLMLEDPMLTDAVQGKVEAGEIIEHAVREATKELAGMLAAMEDEYFAARAVDMEDVGRRLLRLLLGIPDTSLDSLRVPSIVAAHDLTPSNTAQLDPELTLGFCTAMGGLTSHTAILARTLGLPAVVGLGPDLLESLEHKAPLILDGLNGQVIVNPGPETEKTFLKIKSDLQAWDENIQQVAEKPARTACGVLVEVGANIGDADSAARAVQAGAEGVGLLRTEFLYLDQTEPPSETTQVEIYRAIFENFGNLPVIVRTLDIGGDKPPSFLDFLEELNPFLGWRAIRICLDDIPLFKTQLRAILRAAHGHNALIMYPMISSVDELRRANQILAEARAELTEENLPFAEDVPVGIMIETPAAVALADQLAKECDFFSIGTNDLTQYTLAVDRTNDRIAGLFQPLHPAVLRLIRQTIEAAHSQNIWVGMCGELAGMPAAIPILLGLGLDEFSMAAAGIPEAKWVISKLTLARSREIAAHVLKMATAGEIEGYMDQVLTEEIQLPTFK